MYDATFNVEDWLIENTLTMLSWVMPVKAGGLINIKKKILDNKRSEICITLKIFESDISLDEFMMHGRQNERFMFENWLMD